MTTPRLMARIERVELQRSPPATRPMVIHMQEGESDFDLELRIRAAGGHVAVMPRPCATTEEWLARYAPAGCNE